MKQTRKFSIERPEPGVLSHREGGTEFRFPIYEEDGKIIFVAWPTSQRIFLYFLFNGWARVPRHFSDGDRKRITADVWNHFRSQSKTIKVRQPPLPEEKGIHFHPELLEYKGRATEALSAVGLEWFGDYGSIDLMHEEFGLEVCGIHEEKDVKRVARAMTSEFPQWHYRSVCYKDYGREPGWKVRCHMFPSRCFGGNCDE